MIQTIQNIIRLIHKRITFFNTVDNRGFFKWHSTYIEGIQDEIQEVKEELENPDKFMYLEDELWDVFWDYMCLLESLEQEGKIKKSRVFDRCLTKFEARIGKNGDEWNQWNDTKKQQKEVLQCEYDEFCKKKNNLKTGKDNGKLNS